MQQAINPATPQRIVRVKDLPKTPGYGWVTEAAIRHLIFNATPRFNAKGELTKTNGLFESGTIIRIGRKVLVDLDRFDFWVEQHRQSVEV